MENTHNKIICRICGNSGNNKLFKTREMYFGFRDEFNYFQCQECGCLQILEIPLDMDKYYPSNYYSFTQKSNDLNKSKNRLVQFLKDHRNDYAIFNKGLLGRIIYRKIPAEWLKEYLLNYFSGIAAADLFTKKSKILDVGCGTGNLLYWLRELGFKNVLGIDPFGEKNIIYPNGLKILKTNIHELRDKFDLIMFNHSFEHIEDPLETLQSVSRLLVKKGKCLIRIPTVDSYAWEHYKQNWVALDPPRHFFLYSLKSMKILSNKVGFDILKIAYDSTDFQFWGSEQYARDIPHTSERSYSVNKQNCIFSKDEIINFQEEAKRLNSEGKGDCVALCLGLKKS